MTKSSFEVVTAAINKIYARKKIPTVESNLIQVREELKKHGWEMNEYAGILLRDAKENKQ